MIEIKEIRIKAPRLPKLPPLSKFTRPLLVVVVAASLLMSGTSMYVALGAPLRSPYVPSTVGFEGQLADANGNPVANGDYTLTFRLYSVDTGGTALWSETQTVAVQDGLYSVQLGAINALQASDFDGDRWLGVQVSGDSEMTPRIPISAVPFALNASQAMGLQGRDVAANAPGTNNALMWNGSEWTPQGITFPSLAPVGSNANPQDFLSAYRSGAILRYKDANTVEVSAGEVMVNGYMRRNTSAVDVKFAADPGGQGPNRGLDTGTAQSNTTYYIYAVADDAESTFDLIISASSGAPTGVTNYRKLGWFKTNESNTQIMVGSAANVVGQPQFVPATRVYNSTAISLPFNTEVALTFDIERFDTDGIHSTVTNPSRLTVRTPERYLIYATTDIPSSTWLATLMTIRLNGTTIIGRTSGHYQSDLEAWTHSISMSVVYDLTVNDYVEVLVRQRNGYVGPLSIAAIGNYSPEFGMVWLGD